MKFLQSFQIAFNPITNNSIKKTLSRICRQEQCNVVAQHLDIIATASGGDIRQAITSLQLSCFEADRSPSSSQSGYTYASHEHSPFSKLTSHFGRDETLSLFHALGKFLHNKRETEYTSFQGMRLVKSSTSEALPQSIYCCCRQLGFSNGTFFCLVLLMKKIRKVPSLSEINIEDCP